MNHKTIQKIFNSFALFAVISMFTISAFAQSKETKRWIPTMIDGVKIKQTKAFLQFDGTRVSGSAGCNRMFGTVEKNGRTMKFSGIGATKMFCGDENVMKSETALLDALNKTNRFKQKGDTLKLYDGKRLLAKFKMSETIEEAGEKNENSLKLEDKKWILETIKKQPLPKVETEAFLVFNKEKMSAGGNTSCNVFGAEYETKGSNLKITQAIQTFRACVEDERNQIERAFMDALQNTDRYEIKGEKLNLYQGENLLLTFRAAAKEEKN